MELIIDTSIIINAMVKRSYALFTLFQLYLDDVKLYAPDFTREELLDKKEKIEFYSN